MFMVPRCQLLEGEQLADRRSNYRCHIVAWKDSRHCIVDYHTPSRLLPLVSHSPSRPLARELSVARVLQSIEQQQGTRFPLLTPDTQRAARRVNRPGCHSPHSHAGFEP